MQLFMIRVPLFNRMMQYCLFLLPSMVELLSAPPSLVGVYLRMWVKNSRMHSSLPCYSKFISAMKLCGSASRLGPLRSMRKFSSVHTLPSPISITKQGSVFCWIVTSPPFSLGLISIPGFVISILSSYRFDVILIVAKPSSQLLIASVTFCWIFSP